MRRNNIKSKTDFKKVFKSVLFFKIKFKKVTVQVKKLTIQEKKQQKIFKQSIIKSVNLEINEF